MGRAEAGVNRSMDPDTQEFTVKVALDSARGRPVSWLSSTTKGEILLSSRKRVPAEMGPFGHSGMLDFLMSVCSLCEPALRPGTNLKNCDLPFHISGGATERTRLRVRTPR